MVAVVVARERYELALLKREVEVDVQLHVLMADGGDAESELHTLVAHLAEVGEQLVKGEGRHGHIVLIEHVGGARIVVFGSEHDAVVPQADVGAYIECRACLPFQIGVAVAEESHGRGGHVVDRHGADGSDEVL